MIRRNSLITEIPAPRDVFFLFWTFGVRRCSMYTSLRVLARTPDAAPLLSFISGFYSTSLLSICYYTSCVCCAATRRPGLLVAKNNESVDSNILSLTLRVRLALERDRTGRFGLEASKLPKEFLLPPRASRRSWNKLLGMCTMRV